MRPASGGQTFDRGETMKPLARILLAVLVAAALAVAVAPGSRAAGARPAAYFALTLDGFDCGVFHDATFAEGAFVLRDGSGSRALQTWALSGKRADPEVVMYSYDGKPVARYHLVSAWPRKLEVGSLADASKNEVAIESLTLAYEG